MHFQEENAWLRDNALASFSWEYLRQVRRHRRGDRGPQDWGYARQGCLHRFLSGQQKLSKYIGLCSICAFGIVIVLCTFVYGVWCVCICVFMCDSASEHLIGTVRPFDQAQ